jgi:hypothetical protein
MKERRDSREREGREERERQLSVSTFRCFSLLVHFLVMFSYPNAPAVGQDKPRRRRHEIEQDKYEYDKEIQQKIDDKARRDEKRTHVCLTKTMTITKAEDKSLQNNIHRGRRTTDR